ncbi:putative Ig domain-containing protein [Trichormus sp. NMC-1]|uniref:putative Ig domain-containing protein n=1 Tax=Trichormus sp. NMC-1 TaxID=1853259 RepID=UPI0008DC17C6|nr:putative Ig domain-containing protein [Trichormus sp. NMC-1]
MVISHWFINLPISPYSLFPIRYSATLADGSELPDWLSFNPITQTFSGTPAYGDAGQLDVKVIATDKEGAIATDTFSIQIQTPFIFGTTNSEEISPEAGQALFAGDGDDTINSTDDNDIFAGNGNDVVTVNSHSSVSAGDGDDTVIVGANGPALNTTVDGGNGEDNLVVAEANGTNNLFGAADADELQVIEGSRQLLFGGSGNDKISVPFFQVNNKANNPHKAIPSNTPAPPILNTPALMA